MPDGTTIADLVDEARLWDRHMAIAWYGATAGGGVNRPALSPEEADAKRKLIEWGSACGLKALTDAAGNLFLRREGRDPHAAPVLTGSHLDSQPTGGKFDGVFGVLAGLEAMEALRTAGAELRRPIEVVAWMNEEGARFAPGMMGSSVFSGARSLADILPLADADGVSVAEALTTTRERFRDLPRTPLGRPVHAYVEAHIEQGPVLERQHCDIGIVTGIQGKRTFRVRVDGEEGHVGTTRPRDRKDALRTAIAMIQALYDFVDKAGEDATFGVGRLAIEPNVPSVVPARATFSIDLRHPSTRGLEQLGDRIASICENLAGRCGVHVQELSTAWSLEFPREMRERIRNAAEAQHLSTMDILSQAGHDARYLHDICATGMIFVPCAGGLSHCEAESATARDLGNGTRVLAATLFDLAN